MDDVRSKQRKPDDPRYIGIVFADGSGKFMNIGKLATLTVVYSRITGLSSRQYQKFIKFLSRWKKASLLRLAMEPVGKTVSGRGASAA